MFSSRIGLFSLLLVAFSFSPVYVSAQDNLIPRPANMQSHSGYFMTDSTSLFSNQQNNIKFRIDTAFDKSKPEGYLLNVDRSGVTLTAGTEDGLYYGKQTLRQLLTSQGLPYVSIDDYPRFGYRGLHIDVSRHFFPKEEILKIIDVMSYYKLNRLHLHLTDNGGWRIQIDKYPKLTTDAAYRPKMDYMKWSLGTSEFVKKETPDSYGGFYTKEDIREMVAFAQSRHITIIPEIEFPAHASEVFVAYPELCCSEKQYGSTAFCIGNPKVIQFMKDVLTEVIELFPSEYIHVGGDEANKTAWKTCEKCQALMKREGLKDVDELQSYMIRQCEKFLLSKGRRLIGWDEILQGGLAPEATVMSWRGVDGGIAAARMDHDVIMTPYTYCYFDYYQDDPATQPTAIGGYIPLNVVYSYDPVAKDSLTAKQQEHILGVQGNTWSEFIPTSEHLEYMMFPRALAIAEIGWTPQSLRSWSFFNKRVNNNMPWLKAHGINAYDNPYKVHAEMLFNFSQKLLAVELASDNADNEMRYTLDGSDPTAASPVYKTPIIVKDSATVVAAVFKDGTKVGNALTQRVDCDKALGRGVRYFTQPAKSIMGMGGGTLVNGERGSLFLYDRKWQGFDSDMDIAVDLGDTIAFHTVSTTWLRQMTMGMFEPIEIELLTSDDGENFVSQGTLKSNLDLMSGFKQFTYDYRFTGNWKAKYVRLKAKIKPSWQYGDVKMATDELIIW